MAEICFRILECHIMDCLPMVLSMDSTPQDPYSHIFSCALELVQSGAWAERYAPETVHHLRHLLAKRLAKRGVLALLSRVIETSLRAAERRSIEGTLLEQILVSTVGLMTDGWDLGMKSSFDAFKLLLMPNLSHISTELSHHGLDLITLSLPFMEWLLSPTPPSRVFIDVAGPEFRKAAIEATQNLIQLLPTVLFHSEEKSRSVQLLVSPVVRFMNWVIQQNLESEEADDEMELEWTVSRNGSSFVVRSDLQPCLESLRGPQGQLLLKSLISLLFSSTQQSSRTVAEFCEILHSVICSSTDTGHLHSMLLSLTLSGKLIEHLWHNWIKQCWSVSSLGFPDRTLFEALVAPLTVLCEVYSSFLSTASEEEICHQQIPLALIEIYDPNHPEQGLITVLKKCLWQVVWTGYTSTNREVSVSYRQMMADFPVVAGRLLVQLYDKSEQWNLAPSVHFQVQSNQLSQFVMEASSAAASQARGTPHEPSKRTRTLLTHASCLIPFHDRVRIFQAYVSADMTQVFGSSSGWTHPQISAKIRRLYLLEDAFDQLNTMRGSELKRRLRIAFVDEHGTLEAGVDGGGLFKDFLEELIKAGFDPDYGFFAATDQQELYPNPSAITLQPNAIQLMAFLGRMMGKALYEGILLELPFAHFFLKKFQGLRCELPDLASLDADVYKSLMQLRSQKGSLAELGLNFTITDSVYGDNAEVDLKPNGRAIPVTATNVLEYIHRFADYRLNKEVGPTASGFLHGFFDVIQREWVQMFNATELRMLISGSSKGLDISNMRNNAQYAGGYHDDHPVIQSLWEILEQFSADEQRHFLKFVTGCSRAPLLGFEQLQPKMCIQMAGSVLNDHSTERLPTSATCLNMLKLPPYASKDVMAQKLLYAISSKTGFHLS